MWSCARTVRECWLCVNLGLCVTYTSRVVSEVRALQDMWVMDVAVVRHVLFHEICIESNKIPVGVMEQSACRTAGKLDTALFIAFDLVFASGRQQFLLINYK